MRRITIGLAAAALGLYGLGCGEKDEPSVTTVPATTTTTPATPPATTTTAPAKQP
jgi:hypothetical protein